MDRLWMAVILARVCTDEASDSLWQWLSGRDRAQGTVEYGAALLGIAGAAIALWLLLGPAIQQLGQRMVTEVNGVR